MPLTGLDSIKAAIQQAIATLPDDLDVQMQAELAVSAKAIAAASPRSAIKHVHFQDSFRVVAKQIINTRSYAGPVLYAPRKNPGALARQQKLNAAIDAEVERLADAFSQFGIRAERKVSP